MSIIRALYLSSFHAIGQTCLLKNLTVIGPEYIILSRGECAIMSHTQNYRLKFNSAPILQVINESGDWCRTPGFRRS